MDLRAFNSRKLRLIAKRDDIILCTELERGMKNLGKKL